MNKNLHRGVGFFHEFCFFHYSKFIVDFLRFFLWLAYKNICNFRVLNYICTTKIHDFHYEIQIFIFASKGIKIIVLVGFLKRPRIFKFFVNFHWKVVGDEFFEDFQWWSFKIMKFFGQFSHEFWVDICPKV